MIDRYEQTDIDKKGIYLYRKKEKKKERKKEGARGVMVVVVGNGHEFKSWTRVITFHIVLIPLGKV